VDTMSRSVPSIEAYGRFCLVLRPKGLVGGTRKRRGRYCLEVFDEMGDERVIGNYVHTLQKSGCC